MARTLPTATDLKTRLPEFEAVPDATVTLVIAEAECIVGTDWPDTDQHNAMIFLTAHYMAIEGYPQRLAPGAPTINPLSMGRSIVEHSVGEVSMKLAAPSTGSKRGRSGDPFSYRTTPYGVRFDEILRRNHVTAVMAI